MKINKILLRICHFFGFRLNEEHQDDITINIPTVSFLHGELSPLNELIMEDIMCQIYHRFQKDKIIERRCRNVKQVFVTYYSDDKYKTGSILTIIPYIDGVLYNPFEKGINESLIRNNKIDQLLN